jgi:hypothetical protein
MIRRALELALLVVACLACGIGPARADSGVFLSWRAPEGSARARDTVLCACRDTSRADTLYLSFELAKARPALRSIEGSLYFYAAPGDTLGPFWSFKHGTPNGGNMSVEYSPFFDVPTTPPWSPDGQGQLSDLSYDRERDQSHLSMSFFLPEAEITTRVLYPGVRYTFARVIFFHRRDDLAGCRQPVCIEWGNAWLRFGTGREIDLGGPGRFAGWNALPSSACSRVGHNPLTRPWRPK